VRVGWHPNSRRPDERGSALVEFSWLAIVLLVPLVWIVLSVFEVQRGAFAVSAAARAAGRAYALADSDGAGEVRAERAARQALVDQGLGAAPLDLQVTCRPYPHSCHAGTSVITVRVATSVGLPWLPASFGLGKPVFALDSSHTVPIGQFQEVGDARR
jgi:Flp pilus assembly protein TadG